MPRVLIVEDDLLVCSLAAQVLHDAGYETRQANNGLDALYTLRYDGHFDVMLTDIKMPRMDGLHLLDNVHREYPTLPVVVFSAISKWFDKRYTYPDNAIHYLPKPFS